MDKVASKLVTRFTRIHLVPENEPMFHERGFVVNIDDEGAGEFVAVSSNEEDCGEIRIDPEEWPQLREAIDLMVARCKV